MNRLPSAALLFALTATPWLAGAAPAVLGPPIRLSTHFQPQRDDEYGTGGEITARLDVTTLGDAPLVAWADRDDILVTQLDAAGNIVQERVPLSSRITDVDAVHVTAGGGRVLFAISGYGKDQFDGVGARAHFGVELLLTNDSLQEVGRDYLAADGILETRPTFDGRNYIVATEASLAVIDGDDAHVLDEARHVPEEKLRVDCEGDDCLLFRSRYGAFSVESYPAGGSARDVPVWSSGRYAVAAGEGGHVVMGIGWCWVDSCSDPGTRPGFTPLFLPREGEARRLPALLSGFYLGSPILRAGPRSLALAWRQGDDNTPHLLGLSRAGEMRNEALEISTHRASSVGLAAAASGRFWLAHDEGSEIVVHEVTLDPADVEVEHVPEPGPSAPSATSGVGAGAGAGAEGGCTTSGHSSSHEGTATSVALSVLLGWWRIRRATVGAK